MANFLLCDSWFTASKTRAFTKETVSSPKKETYHFNRDKKKHRGPLRTNY